MILRCLILTGAALDSFVQSVRPEGKLALEIPFRKLCRSETNLLQRCVQQFRILVNECTHLMELRLTPKKGERICITVAARWQTDVARIVSANSTSASGGCRSYAGQFLRVSALRDSAEQILNGPVGVVVAGAQCLLDHFFTVAHFDDVLHHCVVFVAHQQRRLGRRLDGQGWLRGRRGTDQLCLWIRRVRLRVWLWSEIVGMQ